MICLPILFCESDLVFNIIVHQILYTAYNVTIPSQCSSVPSGTCTFLSNVDQGSSLEGSSLSYHRQQINYSEICFYLWKVIFYRFFVSQTTLYKMSTNCMALTKNQHFVHNQLFKKKIDLPGIKILTIQNNMKSTKFCARKYKGICSICICRQAI